MKRIVALRWREWLEPVQVAGHLGVPALTVLAVLVRCRINRLRLIDRVTGDINPTITSTKISTVTKGHVA